ncbi:MAG TPA: outer membrane beta-barrel protein [Flavitalea sp.]|nr:outer membrane beta-barrel protein [Flavitalea sp.]
MKKVLALFVALTASVMMIYAQDSSVVVPPATPAPDPLAVPGDTLPNIIPDSSKPVMPERPARKNKWAAMNLETRTQDHLLIQLGYDMWSGKPDSINLKGLSRSVNIYFMLDFPFKASPQFSVGLGAGISTSNMYFKDTYIDIAGRSTTSSLNFQDVSDTTHFKKYKLMNSFLEAPVELRYVNDPVHPKKSFKAAVGLKVGTMLTAVTKGKNLQSSTGQTVLSITQKEKSRRFFNSTRLSLTGRVGIGNFALFASYQINAFIKEGFGPDIRPYSIGLSLSGL